MRFSASFYYYQTIRILIVLFSENCFLAKNRIKLLIMKNNRDFCFNIFHWVTSNITCSLGVFTLVLWPFIFKYCSFIVMAVMLYESSYSIGKRHHLHAIFFWCSTV